jgi:hypothetical protein
MSRNLSLSTYFIGDNIMRSGDSEEAFSRLAEFLQKNYQTPLLTTKNSGETCIKVSGYEK